MGSKAAEISKRYLKELFSRFNRLGLEVGLCGGWAVHLSLAKLGVPHLDSEDIDLFFRPSKTQEKKVVGVIESLGFVRSKEVAWTWRKYFDKRGGKGISIGDWEKLPFERQGTFYIDVLPTEPLPGYLEEGLLDFAFEGEHEIVELEGVKILIPTARLLVSVKSGSAPERQFARKQVKDIADIYAIIENDNSVWSHDRGGRRRSLLINREAKKYFAGHIEGFLASGAIAGAGKMLGVDPGRIYETLKKAYAGRK